MSKKIRYPNHRKSPCQHRVSSHTRQGKPVRSFTRGHGTRPVKIPVKRTVLTKGPIKEPKAFTVNFKYSKRAGDGESVVVIANDYQKALDEAFEEKKDSRQPISVELIDPSLGSMLKIMAQGAGKAVKLGAKYTYIAGKTVGKEAAHAVAKSYRELKLRRLIDEAYSPDKVRRVIARAKLKQRYPEIYKICHFSRERD